jgi:hypothetical protein
LANTVIEERTSSRIVLTPPRLLPTPKFSTVKACLAASRPPIKDAN